MAPLLYRCPSLAWVLSAFPCMLDGMSTCVPDHACIVCICRDCAVMRLFKHGTWFMCSHSVFTDIQDHACFCVADVLEIKGLQASHVSFPYLDVTASLWSAGASLSLNVRHFDSLQGGEWRNWWCSCVWKQSQSSDGWQVSWSAVLSAKWLGALTLSQSQLTVHKD